MDKLVQQTRGNFPLWVSYPLAFILVLLPISDIAIGLFPLQLGNIQWRVGAVGLVSGVMLLPTVGLFLALAVAHAADHFWTRRLLAISAIILGLIFLVVLVLFALDLVQVRREIPEQAHRAFDMAAVKGSVMLLAEAIVFMIFGIASIKADRARRRTDRSGQSTRNTMVVNRPSEPVAQ